MKYHRSVTPHQCCRGCGCLVARTFTYSDVGQPEQLAVFCSRPCAVAWRNKQKERTS